jgi:hypothetical protein
MRLEMIIVHMHHEQARPTIVDGAGHL